MKKPSLLRLPRRSGRDTPPADEGTDTRVEVDPGGPRAEAPPLIVEQREPPRPVARERVEEQYSRPFFFSEDPDDSYDDPDDPDDDSYDLGADPDARDGHPYAEAASAGAGDHGLFQATTDEDDDRDRRDLPVRTVMLTLAVLCLVLVTAVLVRAALRNSTEAPTQVAQQSRAAVPAPPAGAPTYGSYVEARTTSDGDVRVSQWIRSPKQLLGVQLSLPAVTGGSGSISATRLSVVADQSVLNDPTTVHASGRRLFFSAPPTSLYLRYTLHGVTDRSSSVPGRALLRATALDVGYTPQTESSQVVLIGDNVLSTSCVGASGETPRPCGDAGKGRWAVTLKGHHRADSVMAQVDLG